MSTTNSVVAVFESHDQAEDAIRERATASV